MGTGPGVLQGAAAPVVQVLSKTYIRRVYGSAVVGAPISRVVMREAYRSGGKPGAGLMGAAIGVSLGAVVVGSALSSPHPVLGGLALFGGWAIGALLAAGAWRAASSDAAGRTAEAREMAGARLEPADIPRLRPEFLANLSHEIRTPMNGILGMTDLVLETDLEPEQREFVETIRSSADALLTIINDILDFSKMEVGRLELESIPFRPRTTLRETLRTLTPAAQAKGLELSARVLPDVPETALGDPGRFRQILMNLVANAVKFTEQGKITVIVRRLSETDRDANLEIEVADTGIGIPQDKQDSIFEPFTQVDVSTSRRYGGTGLGLAIVSQLVELMQGRVWVESVPGRGSAFRFTMRVALDPKSSSSPSYAGAEDLRSLNVLIVDDNRTNRKVLLEMLRSWDMLPRIATSAGEALELLRQAVHDGDRYALALIDVQMPEMDGFALMKAIREDPALTGLKVVLLTSSGLRGDAARCRDLGIAGYLTKPIMASDLLQTIQAVVGADPEDRDRPLVTRHLLLESRRVIRILLAEDDPVNRTMITRMLERAGHSVQAVSDGRRALEAMDEGRFDLVMLDVQMPEVGGLETAAEIRRREGGSSARIPLVAMTARAMKGDREACLAAGMDAYVAKPISAVRLFETIDRVIPGAGLQDAPGQRPRDAAAFDGGTLLARAEGDMALLAEMLGMFRRDSDRLMSELRTALEASEAHKAQQCAHRLAGSLLTLTASRGAHVARSIEAAARERRFAEARDALASLEAEIKALDPDFEALQRELALS